MSKAQAATATTVARKAPVARKTSAVREHTLSASATVSTRATATLAQGRIQRLTDPEFAERLKAFNAKLASDPEFAREMLTSAGLLTKAGNLKKSFGG